MTDDLFDQLEDGTLRTLLERTALQDAGLLLIGPSLHVAHCTPRGAQITGLHPMERVDPVLSEAALAALRDCVAHHTAHTLSEELDGIHYRLEVLPQTEGALLAFLREEATSFSGSLRVMHAKTARCLDAIWADADKAGKAGKSIQRQCLRLRRMLIHSEKLHEPLATEQLRLQHGDLAALCREACEVMRRRTKRIIRLDLPESLPLLMEESDVRRALYNLLVNAVQVTPEPEEITVCLRDDGANATITVADHGRGLPANVFATLLDGWKRTLTMEDYLALGRAAVQAGYGLPLARLVAEQHGGRLLLSPREGGGSELHLVLAHLPDALAENNLHAPMVIEEGHRLEDIELSVL